MLAWFRDIAFTGAVYALFRWGPAWLRTQQAEKILQQAIDYAFGAVENAEKGKVLQVTIANDVLRMAESYVVSLAPGLATKLGDLLKPRLLAQLGADTPVPAATAASLGAALPPPAK